MSDEIYNLTDAVWNSTNIAQVHAGLNAVSDGYLVIAELIVLGLLMYIVAFKNGSDSVDATMVSGFGMSLVVTFYWMAGLAPVSFLIAPIFLVAVALMVKFNT